MKRKIRVFSLLLMAIFAISSVVASSSREMAESKMTELEQLIKVANKRKINTLKEQTALRTAEIFMGYADWDEKNVEKNVENFSLVTRYKSRKREYAELLPEFERQDIIKMMDSSIEELQAVMDGDIKRLDTPNVDWTKVDVVGDQILFKGKPVFLADWTWKPRVDYYNDYHGNQDGFLLTPGQLISEDGELDPAVLNELKSKPSGSAGFIFFNHTSFPEWAVEKDPTVLDGPGIKYTMYDINNPLSRYVQSSILSKAVPIMKGKNYTKLGYMLCNEPHWNTIEGSWAAAPFSELAYAEFLKWLEKRHKSIATLNSIWGTSFKSFESIDVPRIMTDEQQGTPLYFDYMSFNQDRVTDWFLFLRDEIQKHDPAAKTHIKVMPNLWSEGKRDSGIDMEAITRNTEIIGNDVSSCGRWMFGEPHHWEEYYAFDWTEMCMAQDFFTSVSPGKIMYNTEGHMLSTGKTRDLYQDPQYARCNYWMTTIHGMTATQTWFWCRREDGSSRPSNDNKGYAGSNNHQPRIVNEVHATILDLNSVSDKIMAFQRQRKPIRVFYTKASSINDLEYIDDVFSMYEALSFQGQPIGFATEGIINENEHAWQAITIYKTPKAFPEDIVALQSYLDEGGSIVMDSESLVEDQYGRPFGADQKLKSSKGKVIVLDSVRDIAKEAMSIVEQSSDALSLVVEQDNNRVQDATLWRVISDKSGAQYMNISNIGVTDSEIKISQKSGKKIKSITNVLTGESFESEFVLKPYDTYLLEIQ